jgi:hypothetical protein
MFFTIYKTTNTKNNKYYLGKHQTENLRDGYLGSGIALINAIKKYGKDSFDKEILFIFDNEIDMNNKEKELITEKIVSSKNTYNKGIGGEGGPHFKGKRHSEEMKKNLSEKIKSQEHKLTEEGRRRIIENNKNRIISDETKRKLSEKAKLRWSINKIVG